MKKLFIVLALIGSMLSLNMAHADSGKIIRSAYLAGTVTKAEQAKFDTFMNENVVPEIKKYTQLRDLKLRYVKAKDPSAPDVYMVFDMYFDSIQEMDAALASPVRKVVQDKLAEIMPKFKGKVYHLITNQD